MTLAWPINDSKLKNANLFIFQIINGIQRVYIFDMLKMQLLYLKLARQAWRCVNGWAYYNHHI